MSGDLTFFNANQGPAPGYQTFWVWNNIFNSLLTMTPPPELKVVPELATSWEVLDEGKTHVFHLRQGVNSMMALHFDAQWPSGISTAFLTQQSIPGCAPITKDA